MEKLKLHFDYGVNITKDYKTIDPNQTKSLNRYHSQESLINEVARRDNQIEEMEHNQKILLKRNLELENSIGLLQKEVCRINQVNKEREIRSSQINSFDLNSLRLCNENKSKNIQNNLALSHCHNKSTRNQEILFNKLYSKTENDLNSYCPAKPTKRKTMKKIKPIISIKSPSVKPLKKTLSLTSILRKKNNKTISKASSTLTSSMKKSKLKDNDKSNQENNQLLKQIAFLQKVIKELNEEFALNQLENKGERFVNQEIAEWKQRNVILSQNYIDSVHILNQRKINDREEFHNEIKYISNHCNHIIIRLKHQCEMVIEKQKDTIEHYRQDNGLIKKRLSKAGKIIGKK